MITVSHREQLRMESSRTARFIGEEHGAGVSFFWVDSEKGRGPDPHRHPYTETWVVLSGEAVVTADGAETTVGAGAVVTVGAGTVHHFRSVGGERLEMVCIHASPAIIQEFVPE
jgi:mannose-6-phosphate isomerase-like protein (cupin superfamily)